MQYQVLFSKRLIIIDKQQYEMQYQVLFSKSLIIIDKLLTI